MSEPSSPHLWDVVIAGAGPAGAVCAAKLARRSIRVALVDGVFSNDEAYGHAPPPRRLVGESLPGAARRLLRDVDLLDRMEDGPYRRSLGTAARWGEGTTHTDALADPDGAGWHLDRAAFNAQLRQAARDRGATCVAATVRDVEREDASGTAGWRMRLTSGPVRAHWVVDATGRASVVGRRLGAVRRRDTPLVALVAWTHPLPTTGERRTWIEARPDGWWYTAPLPDGRRVAALHLLPDAAAAVRKQPGEWHRRLQEAPAIVRQFDGMDVTDPELWEDAPRGADAGGAWLDVPGGPQWLAVGDAALCFDPLSSQGLFNALYTGLRAADAICEGKTTSVRRYVGQLGAVRRRYRDHLRDAFARQTAWTSRGFWTAMRRDVGLVPAQQPIQQAV